LLDEARELAGDDAFLRAIVRAHEGFLALHRADLTLAAACGSETAPVLEALGDRYYHNRVLWLCGQAALQRGNLAQAAILHERLLHGAEELHDDISFQSVQGGLAGIAEQRGEMGAALKHRAAAAEIAAGFGDLWAAAHHLAMAAMTLAQHDPERGARLLGSADAIQGAIGASRSVVYAREQPRQHRATVLIREALGPEAFSAAWTEGAALTLDDAIETISAAGERYVTIPSADAERLGAVHLTVREREVLRLLAEGLADKEIALTLGISRHTASGYAAALRENLRAPSRTAVVTIAMQQGLL
jgi:non-specific serine/threonine protein kinase